MSGDLIPQLFVLLQVFLIGLLAAIVVRYGYVHFRPRKNQPPAPSLAPKEETLSAEAKAQLAKESQEDFHEALTHSVQKLSQDLEVTTQHINNLVMRVATEIVSGELEKYRAEFTELHKQAVADMGGINDELAKQRAEMEAKLASEVEAEKQRLVKQLDTKLGDAVASFLLDTLQHNVDLGNQQQYLVSLLEENKAEFVKEMADESQPAK
jgi:hypothetical protein